MTLFLIALLAGLLTVLSPCVLPLLPVIVGGSLAGGSSIRRALTVTISLGISVFLFTILLKVSTAFITVPAWFWSTFSGVLIIVVGLVMLFPKVWDALPFAAKMNARSNKAMSAGFMKQSFWGDVLVGAALGPVFSTCSPTYCCGYLRHSRVHSWSVFLIARGLIRRSKGNGEARRGFRSERMV
jgi:cytochrome c-type biogenesis protein